MDETVAAYRKIIVLMDNGSALEERNRQRVRTAAWILFERNHAQLEKLEEELRDDLATKNSPLTDEFLTRLESGAFRDADKLAFRDLLDGLASIPSEQAANALLRKRIADDVALDDYRPLANRVRNAVVRRLPLGAVNRLSRLKATLAAMHASRTLRLGVRGQPDQQYP